MRSPSGLNEQGSSSTSVSHYTGIPSSDIVVVSKLQSSRDKKDNDVITVIPIIPNKEDDDKDITAMPVIPDKKDDVFDDIPMLTIPCAVLCCIATLCMCFFRS